MYKIRTILIVAFFLSPLIQFAQHTDQINSNRPGETMSAFSVGKSVFQVETGLYGIKEKHDILNYDANGFGIDLTIRYGAFLEKLELIADFQYQSEKLNPGLIYADKSGLNQTVLGAKYLIYDPFKNYEKKINVYSWKANRAFDWHQLIPAVSVFAGVNFTTTNNPYHLSPISSISPKAMLITQNHLGDGSWVFVTNIIANNIKTDYQSYSYGITLTKGFNKNWSGFLENQGYKSDYYSDAIFRAGAAYLINDDMQVDVSISNSLKNTPSTMYGGIGVSWRFDGNYKEVRMKIDSGDSSKKAKRRAKKTKKG